MRIWSLILALSLSSAQMLAQSQAKSIDYDKFDLTLQLKALRAGNHDPSGLNSYYFKAIAYTVPLLKEEQNKSLAERQKFEKPLGQFAALEIKSLKHWPPEKKPSAAFSLAISGDLIREMVAETMRNFKVSEANVAVFVRIEMLEKAKKFGLLGEDLKVTESVFTIIPETEPHTPILTNQEIKMNDPSGTEVLLNVHFKITDQKQAASNAGAETPGSPASPK